MDKCLISLFIIHELSIYILLMRLSAFHLACAGVVHTDACLFSPWNTTEGDNNNKLKVERCKNLEIESDTMSALSTGPSHTRLHKVGSIADCSCCCSPS